jgi:hypothetical protein
MQDVEPVRVKLDKKRDKKNTQDIEDVATNPT